MISSSLGEYSYISLSDEIPGERFFKKSKNSYDERCILVQNKCQAARIERNERRERENNAPDDFPSFVIEEPQTLPFVITYLPASETGFW